LIDTSSFIKRYVIEPGSEEISSVFSLLTEAVVAPTMYLEIQSVLARRCRDKSLSLTQVSFIEGEVCADMEYVSIVKWNKDLESTAKRLIRKYPLKTLDGIQLAAGKLALVDVFVTSDKQLLDAAKNEFEQVKFVV
jgi:predicted nucleic acid-binding protein